MTRAYTRRQTSDFEELDEDMNHRDLIEILERVRFADRVTLRMDRGVLAYLLRLLYERRTGKTPEPPLRRVGSRRLPYRLQLITAFGYNSCRRAAVSRCGAQNCAYKPLNVWERVGVSALVGGLVVIQPILNAMGVAMNQNLLNALPVVNGSMVLFGLAWALGIYLAVKEAADHHLTLVLNSMGFPGTLVGLALIFSK
jgi:hypothetical protein